MKKTLFTLLLAAFATVVFAQNEQRTQGEDMATRRAQMIKQRTTQLIKSMRLTDEDEAWFTQLYTEYQDSLFSLRDALRPQSQPEEVNGMKDMKKFTDEQAQQMILNQFNMEEKQVTLKRAYYEKFSTRLTAKQLMLLFMGPSMNDRRQQQNGQNRGGYPGQRGWGGPGGGWGGPGRF